MSAMSDVCAQLLLQPRHASCVHFAGVAPCAVRLRVRACEHRQADAGPLRRSCASACRPRCTGGALECPGWRACRASGWWVRFGGCEVRLFTAIRFESHWAGVCAGGAGPRRGRRSWAWAVVGRRRQRFEGARQGRKERESTSRRARLAWSGLPGFFPGEPAPGGLAYGLGCPAWSPSQGAAAFRELSRPMSDSTPRRGDAHRHLLSFKGRRCARRKGAVQSRARRSNSPRQERPPVSARGARRGGACANARCADV